MHRRGRSAVVALCSFVAVVAAACGPQPGGGPADPPPPVAVCSSWEMRNFPSSLAKDVSADGSVVLGATQRHVDVLEVAAGSTRSIGAGITFGVGVDGRPDEIQLARLSADGSTAYVGVDTWVGADFGGVTFYPGGRGVAVWAVDVASGAAEVVAGPGHSLLAVSADGSRFVTAEELSVGHYQLLLHTRGVSEPVVLLADADTDAFYRNVFSAEFSGDGSAVAFSDGDTTGLHAAGQTTTVALRSWVRDVDRTGSKVFLHLHDPPEQRWTGWTWEPDSGDVAALPAVAPSVSVADVRGVSADGRLVLRAVSGGADPADEGLWITDLVTGMSTQGTAENIFAYMRSSDDFGVLAGGFYWSCTD